MKNPFYESMLAHVSLLAVSVMMGCAAVSNAGAALLKITIAGDSTAAYFPPSDAGGRWGWGQALSNHNFFSTNVVVIDSASSGRSSKSFYDEGKWSACLATHANYYFIQFGHNDGKIDDPTRYTDPQTTFKQYLSNYVNQARSNGGIPVLLTPPTRRSYLAEHTLKRDDLQDYALAMRQLGTNMNVAVMDVLPDKIEFFEFIGKSNAPAYQAANTGTTPPIPGADGTHFSPIGAKQHCYHIIEHLLNSTNGDLSALRAEVRKSGVVLKLDLPSSSHVQFRASLNLVDWSNYGSQQVFPPSTVQRYFWIMGEPSSFFTAVVTPN